jgi:hypothetical protein
MVKQDGNMAVTEHNAHAIQATELRNNHQRRVRVRIASANA